MKRLKKRDRECKKRKIIRQRYVENDRATQREKERERKIKTERERLQLHKLEIFHGLFVAHFMGPGWYRPTYLQSADGKQSI